MRLARCAPALFFALAGCTPDVSLKSSSTSASSSGSGGADLTSSSSVTTSTGAESPMETSSTSATSTAVTGGGASGPTVLYVDGMNGLDAQDGSTPALAKHTIPAAIAAAGSGVFPDVTAIHVCVGPIYDGFTLGRPLSVLGGFTCGGFLPGAGYTVLQSPGGAPGPTVKVDGKDVDASSKISGFEIHGSSSEGGRSVGVEVDLGAPTVSGNMIFGGEGRVDAPAADTSCAGSVGVLVAAEASITLDQNTIYGGIGQNHCTTSNGEASTTMAQVGAYLFGNGCTVTGNSVYGSTEADLSGANRALLVYGDSSVVSRNTIVGGSKVPTGSPTSFDGVTVALQVGTGTGNVIAANRISANPGSSATVESLYLISGSSSDIVANNLVYGAVQVPSPDLPPASVYAVHLLGSGHLFAFNTVFSGYEKPTGGYNGAQTLTLGASPSTSSATVENNIFFGDDVNGAIYESDATLSSVASFAGNVVFGATAPLYLAKKAQTFEAVELLLPTVKSNFFISDSCGTDSSCVVDADCAPTMLSICAPSLLQWSTDDDYDYGVLEMGTDGFAPNTGAPCVLLSSKVAGPADMIFKTDILGTPAPGDEALGGCLPVQRGRRMSLSRLEQSRDEP